MDAPIIDDCVVVKANVLVQDWREAIREAGKLLLKNNMIETSYIDAMIAQVETKGPYIVLTKGLAMPHARPSDGALKIGVGLLTLAEPIYFGHEKNDPVKIVAALSSVDSTSHLTLISRLAKILGCKNTINSIVLANSSLEIYNLLKGGCDA